MTKRPTMFHLIFDLEGEMQYGIYSTFELAKAEVDKFIAGVPDDYSTFTHKVHSRRRQTWTCEPVILTIEELDVDLPMEG